MTLYGKGDAPCCNTADPPVSCGTMNRLPVLPILLGCTLALTASARERTPREVRWQKQVLDPKFRSEGVAVADVNRDRKPDLLAGDLWFEGPHWRPHEIRKPGDYDPATGYSNCFLCFAGDVDSDGWTDQIVAGFPGQKATWLRNPGRSEGPWPEYPLTSSASNESPAFADVTGDGKSEFITGSRGQYMAFCEPGPRPEEGWMEHRIGDPGSRGSGHGLGIGDMNGDGRRDILCKEGYWEAPQDRRNGTWKFTAAALGPDCAQMYTYDFDGDADMDVISSSAHAIGVWWYEQVAGPSGPEFRQHVIDTSFSQSHSLMMADLNGDGRPDFVTGKRWWAHGPSGDVNPNDPAVLCWYEFRRKGREVEWTRHEIDRDSGVGTQFAIADVTGDRLPDLIISNKKGVFLFRQL